MRDAHIWLMIRCLPASPSIHDEIRERRFGVLGGTHRVAGFDQARILALNVQKVALRKSRRFMGLSHSAYRTSLK